MRINRYKTSFGNGKIVIEAGTIRLKLKCITALPRLREYEDISGHEFTEKEIRIIAAGKTDIRKVSENDGDYIIIFSKTEVSTSDMRTLAYLYLA